jgi:ArsR family metal-binding transcriptional regulator
MFLDSIIFTRFLPCLAVSGKIIIIGKPSRPLDDVLPYLATLPGIIAYNPETHTLTFRRQPGFLTLYSDKVYITQVNDTQQGLDLLKALTDAINATWERRAELVALTVRRRAPRPLDVWTLLPQTNCGQCGESTCMAFACNLLLQNRSVAECLPLMADSALIDRRATLEAML